jgi:trimethylamine---corrinoid protein Co-methyltransferase
MPTLMRVLSDADVAAIHEQSVTVLAKTGMRVDSERARRILESAGAQVHESERRVRFPRALVEAALASAPKQFSLGARRPGFSLPMNAGECTLMPDGESTMVYDPVAGVRRAPTWDDWAAATKLVDTMDEVGAYWRMINSGIESSGGPGPAVSHWANTFGLFSKHVQDEIATEDDAAWLLELLGIVFGGREAVRRDHPFSVLFCPVSPLAMEAEHTDAYLATAGWDIPIAIMPMPMMGTSAPTGLRSTVVSGNAEVLGAICLVQAAGRGTPVIYAPALAAMEPRSGRWGGGSPEHSLLGAATTEMARFYGLPVTSSNGGTDHFVTGVQAAYERTINWGLPVLSWPDILIGPGSLGGASTLCLEQMVIDVETYRMWRHIRNGISAGVGEPDVVAALDEVGPVGDFLSRTGTRDAVRGGEFFMPGLGYHGTFDRWEAMGRPDVLGQAREIAWKAIDGHTPLPFADGVAEEMTRLEAAARASAPSAPSSSKG